jgi:hypothetical protein
MKKLLHIKITQLGKCRICFSLVVSVATSLQLVVSVASWLQSVVNVVESYYHDDDTKEALETSHVLGLKEEIWFTGVKHLLTPERDFQSRVWRGNTPLKHP